MRKSLLIVLINYKQSNPSCQDRGLEGHHAIREQCHSESRVKLMKFMSTMPHMDNVHRFPTSFINKGPYMLTIGGSRGGGGRARRAPPPLRVQILSF